MKKFILVFVAIAITAGAYAQVDVNRNENSSGTDQKVDKTGTIQNQDKTNAGTIQSQDKTNSGTIQNRDNSSSSTILNRDNNTQDPNWQNNSADKSQTDGVVMKNGKIMQVKNGKTVALGQNMTMSNGTQIMSDGSYIKKDGSKMKFKEGQHMDMSGNLVPLKTNKDKNMYLLPDSTKQ